MRKEKKTIIIISMLKFGAKWRNSNGDRICTALLDYTALATLPQLTSNLLISTWTAYLGAYRIGHFTWRNMSWLIDYTWTLMRNVMYTIQAHNQVIKHPDFIKRWALTRCFRIFNLTGVYNNKSKPFNLDRVGLTKGMVSRKRILREETKEIYKTVFFLEKYLHFFVYQRIPNVVLVVTQLYSHFGSRCFVAVDLLLS